MVDRVRYLDGWRGCAILAVILGHYFTSQGLNLARFGVELFFVLSGRLMAEILFVREKPLVSFFVRRFSRVYPALLFFSLSMLVVAALLGTNDPTRLQFLSVVTLTYNYAFGAIGRTSLLGHTWSLCVEEHMYILLGMVALLCRKYSQIRPVQVLIALISAAVTVGAVQTFLGMHYYDVYWRSDVRGASILMGAAAYLTLRDNVPAWLSPRYIPVALAIIALALNVNAIPDPIKYSFGTASLAMSLVLIHRSWKWVLAILEHRALWALGTLSYSLYLWQQPFYKAGHGVLERIGFLPLAIIAAILSYKLIEQPARRMINEKLHTLRSGIAENTEKPKGIR